MLTANFTQFMYVFLRGSASITDAIDVAGGGQHTLNAEALSLTVAMKNAVSTEVKNTTNGRCVAFGSGTTPATAHDYNLEAQITSGITVSNPTSAVMNQTEDSYEFVATYGIYASRDTVISEIGLFISNNGNFTYMLDRTVLETPIVIPAGQSKQVTYTIRLNKPK